MLFWGGGRFFGSGFRRFFGDRVVRFGVLVSLYFLVESFWDFYVEIVVLVFVNRVIGSIVRWFLCESVVYW